MNFLPPLARQLIVASSPQLAALSVGGLTGYPAVLLNQLKNDTSIHVDPETSSWMASIHGLAGLPSILIPTIMQWKGRRFAFIAACMSTLIGWILTFAARNAKTILIGESFHGFGGNSLIAVSLITISEMVDPKFRNTSMMLFGVNQMLGYVLVTFAGYFLNWRTVSLVMGAPTLTALLLVFIWPESPPWLACKGEFDKCEEAFILLRGTGKEATRELVELITAQRETLREALKHSARKSLIKDVWFRVKRRDFYLPCFHVLLIMFTFYFSGPLVVFTYAVDIIASTTNESDFICFVFIDVIVIIASLLSIVLMKYFKNRPIMIASLSGSAFFAIFASIIMYCKNLNVFPKESLLVCMLGFIFCCTFGSTNLTFNWSAELIPVKHRGLGGAIYIIISCMFHSGSLKVTPYMFDGISVAGTFIFFGIVCITGVLIMWKLIPETKGRTLQEIEDYYNAGYFMDRNRYTNEDETADVLMVTYYNDVVESI